MHAAHHDLRGGAPSPGDDRQPETVAKKQHTALEDLRIRQYQDVCRLEVQLRVGIGNELDLVDDSAFIDAVDFPANRVPVLSGVLSWPARDDKSVIASLGHETFERAHEVLEPLVRRDVEPEQERRPADLCIRDLDRAPQRRDRLHEILR